MKWDELSAPEFEKAVAACKGVCVVPIGVIEKHGDHLPLGTDMFEAGEVAKRAALLESVMVFPDYWFGQNTHAKTQPGAIAVKFDLLLALLESVCDEIARNGFDRIILMTTHGGNHYLLHYFLEKLLDAPKNYTVYVMFSEYPEDGNLLTGKGGHAGEKEISSMLAIRPELVKNPVAPDYGLPLGREDAFRKFKVDTATGWYAGHPGMLSADQTPGSAEKGEYILEFRSRRLAEIIRLVKEDDTPVRLYREFSDLAGHPRRSTDGLVSE